MKTFRKVCNFPKGVGKLLFANSLKEGWTITNDPLSFKVGNVSVQIDLGAERLIAAERGMDKIAIEIKTFGNLSFITALYASIKSKI